MKTIKGPKLWIIGGLLGILFLVMTISDIYYSNLSEKYPVLSKDEFMEGKVTGLKVHYKHAYIELDFAERRNIPPSFLVGPKTDYFHKMVELGDHFIHEVNSENITLQRDDEFYKYAVSNLYPEY